MMTTDDNQFRILVIEDDPGDFELVHAYVRLAGLGRGSAADPVVWAKTLAEGIVAARQGNPDVVLLDLSLPDSAGLATVRAVRDALPALPIVVLTGLDDRHLALEALEAGAQDYLIKGQFEHDALGRAIRHALVREKLEQELLQYQRQLENTVAERTSELLRALEASEAANRAKSAFLANMSHEIRTPMHGILGLAAMLSAEGANPRQQAHLVKLEDTAQHLMGILNDVLDISKIEAGKVALDLGVFDPAALLQAVCSVIEPQAQGKGLYFKLDADAALPVCLLGDALRLKQILINLAGNAVKFTERGGVTLGARIERRTADKLLVRFSVDDTGVGISIQDQERIFTAFEQADNSFTREHGGTGLGLTICRHFAELMGSAIELQSTPGQGSCFSLAVNLGLELAAAAPGAAAATGQAVPLRGARVLVAEDDLLNQEIVVGLLEEAGVKVDLAADGAAAIELATRNAYDLILMDLHMPVMDGVDASRRIRQLPGHRTTPIIALTADAFSSVREQCLQAGMNDHISKPFDADQLYDVVRKWLGK